MACSIIKAPQSDVKKTNSEDVFTINTYIIDEALKKLNNNEFALFMYFVSKENGKEYTLDHDEMCSFFRLTREAYENALYGLEDKGYLIEEEDRIVFRDYPRSEE